MSEERLERRRKKRKQSIVKSLILRGTTTSVTSAKFAKLV